MQPIILFPLQSAYPYEQSELRVAKEYFQVIELRCICPKDRLVIGRHSVPPSYRELERDIEIMGSRLVNTWKQHRWATTFDYYYDLRDFTAEFWDDSNVHLCDHPGPFVVEWLSNSLEHQWKFAKTKRQAIEVGKELVQDSNIRELGVIYRRDLPLSLYKVGFGDLWRLFYLGSTRLSHGCYWSLFETVEERTLSQEGFDFADRVAAIASQHTRFFTLDVAEKKQGGWTLKQVNDAQSSALQENDAHVLYENLRKALSDLQQK